MLRIWAVLLILLVAASGCFYSGTRTHRSADDDTVSIEYSSGRRHLKMKAKGDLELSDDFSKIVGIESGGFVEISERVGLSGKRTVEIRPGEDGELEYRFFRGLRRVDDDRDAREWLENVVADVIQESGLGTEQRARQLLDSEGVAAVLAEARRLRSDHARNLVLGVLLDEAELEPVIVAEIFEFVGDDFDSEYYKAQALDRLLDAEQARGALGDPFFRALDRLGSEYYRAQLLTDVIEDGGSVGTILPELVTAVEELGSEYYRYQLLNSLLDHHGAEEGVITEVLAATHSLGSEYYRAEMISRLLEEPSFDDPMGTLNAIEELGSEHYQTQLLFSVVDGLADASPEMTRFLEVTADLDSEHYKMQVLERLLERDDLSEATLRSTLGIVRERFDNNSYRGRLLDELTGRLFDDA